MDNTWSEAEYSKFKLLLHPHKVQSLLDVLAGKKRYDELPPISVEMHLTNQCNLSCGWCTDKALRNKTSMPREVASRVIGELTAYGVGVTIEGGGEPAMHTAWRPICELAASNGAHLGLITNGVVMVGGTTVDAFRWIRVSLDSGTRDEYLVEKGADRFDRVVENLKQLAAYRSHTQIGVGYVLTTRTIDSAIPMLALLDEIGVDYMYLRPVEEAPELQPSRERMYELRQGLLDASEGRRIKFALTINDRLVTDNDGLPCVAHGLSPIIRADGDVMLCEKRRHDLVCIGNVNEHSFMEVWRGERRREVTAKLLDPKNQLGCQTCRLTSVNRILADVRSVRTGRFV